MSTTKLIGWGLVVVLAIGGIKLALGTLGFIGGAATNAAEVAKKEFYPEAALRKYEWFKDAYHSIKSRDASIAVFEDNINNMCQGEMLKQNFVQCGQWKSEVAGTKAGLNALIAEYTAASDKFNWSMFNAETDRPPVDIRRR